MVLCLFGISSEAQSVFETFNKISLHPILDGDYGGIIIPNAGIGMGYSRILNRRFEVEITFGYKVGLLRDTESLAIEKLIDGDYENMAFKRVTEVGLNFKSYLFQKFGSIAPVGSYLQIGLQRSLLHLTHYDRISPLLGPESSSEPRFAIVRTIDLTLGIGKSIPLKNNFLVGAYGGLAIPLNPKYMQIQDNTDPFSEEFLGGKEYYRNGSSAYLFLNNGFQVRFTIAKAF